MRIIFALLLAAFAAPLPAGDKLTVTMHAVDATGVGDAVGEVTVKGSAHGVVFAPDLDGLPPGLHGFHVHQHGSCEPGEDDGENKVAHAAGGHYDPADADAHGKPWGDGHRGDLPALFVRADGRADYPVLAPRLELDELAGRSLMVHAGGDNHADHPQPLGGGGARLYCGVID